MTVKIRIFRLMPLGKLRVLQFTALRILDNDSSQLCGLHPFFLQNIMGMIADNDSGSCPCKSEHVFHHNSLFINITQFCSSFYHRVLCRNILTSHRQSCVSSHRPNDVKISQSGLYHHNISTFRFINLRFPHGFPGISIVHLVGFPVPFSRC